jgi:chromosome segregation ATPase
VAEEVQRVAEVVEGKNRRIGELEGRIGDLERELEEVRAKEYDDVIANTQKMSEIDLQFMQLKKRIEDQARDKRLIEEDLYSARDKLKEILREKLAVQNEFH